MTKLAPAAVLVALVGGIFIGESHGPSTADATLIAAIALAAIAGLAPPARPRLTIGLVAVVLLGSSLSQRALHGLVEWPLAGAVAERRDATVAASLVDDPDGTRYSTRVLVRLDSARLGDGRSHDAGGRTVLVVGEADAAPRLALLDAGDHVVLEGWLRPLEPYDEQLRWRHAVARFDALELVSFHGPTSVSMRVANAARGVVLRGTSTLPPTERGLVAGFLLGDTRALPDGVLQDFRSGGLSHLLAVSGANVAFTLGLMGPVLRRLPRMGRLAGTLAVLAVFGAMTRWEPSVMRACAMAACAVVAVHLGRPARATRLLAVAATALLVIDPFLVHSVGFQLSCAASLGIALLSAPIAARLRGPEWMRESLATTAAAQIGVAPVLLPVFGSMPLVALPANLLAVPIAGPLTIWGLAAGGAAGLLHGLAPTAATVLQLPTRLMADGMIGIADAASRAPIAVDLGTAVVLGVLVAVTVAARHRRMLRGDALVVPPR